MKFLTALVMAGALTLSSTPALATTIVFSGGSSGTDGTDGNIRVFSVGGITVQASAFSYSGTTLTNAWLGHYGNGLGVTNRSEGNGSSASSHTADNLNQQDLILLIFDQAVNLTSARLNPYQVSTTPADNDAWVSYASLAGAYTSPTPTALSTASTVWGTIAANGRNVTGNLTSPYATPLGTGTTAANIWVIGASRTGFLPTPDGNPDGFKLGQIDVTAVPESSTWAMMIVGFVGIGAAARRQRRSLKLATA